MPTNVPLVQGKFPLFHVPAHPFTLWQVFSISGTVSLLKGQFLKTESSLPDHTCTCLGESIGWELGHTQPYLVKAPQGDASYHDGGVQSEPGEEAGTLQGHICQRLRNANGP